MVVRPSYHNKNNKIIKILPNTSDISDIIIEFHVEDGSTIIQRIPVKSLALISGYADTKLKNEIMLSDVMDYLQDIIKGVSAFYSSIGIKITSCSIKKDN